MFENCKAKVLKSKLAEHLEKECSQRKAECTYCSDEMPFADLEVHVCVKQHEYTRQLNCFI